MRILIAPDKFKGSLTAAEAAAAMRRGVERAAREVGIEIEIDECPVADGGEGTVDALARASAATLRTVEVPGPLGEPVTARWALARPPRSSGLVATLRAWLVHARGRTAFIECASAAGLSQVPAGGRDPERAGTAGLGGLIAAALDAGCSKIVLGLGGSATADGGIGAVGALGAVFHGADGGSRQAVGASLGSIRTVVTCDMDPRLRGAQIIALCDVRNPLLGPRGAARMFGPQKGATPEQVDRLEAGLENLVRVCRECNIPCDPDAPGAGAAGGLGFGLAAFLGARLVPGAPYILDLLKFDGRCKRADLVITGEGAMDMQTAEGKACAAVARAAERAGKPCIAVVGTTEEAPDALRRDLAESGVRLDTIHRLTDLDSPAENAAGNAANRLEEAARRAVAARLSGTR